MENIKNKYIRDVLKTRPSYQNFNGQVSPLTRNGDPIWRSASGVVPATMAQPQTGPSTNLLPKSRPYAIQIVNSSSTASGPIDLFGANEYLSGGVFSDGSLVIGGITISAIFGTPNYQSMLHDFLSRSFVVGYTYITSATAAQVTVPMTLHVYDSTGTFSGFPINNLIAPTQFQSTVLINDQPFTVDSYTKITFTQILASTTVSIYLYPQTTASLSDGVTGGGVVNQYGPPSLSTPKP